MRRVISVPAASEGGRVRANITRRATSTAAALQLRPGTQTRIRRFSGSADDVINAGLDALEREQRRAQARRDAARLAADPDDRAEMDAVLHDLTAPLDTTP